MNFQVSAVHQELINDDVPPLVSIEGCLVHMISEATLKTIKRLSRLGMYKQDLGLSSGYHPRHLESVHSMKTLFIYRKDSS